MRLDDYDDGIQVRDQRGGNFGGGGGLGGGGGGLGLLLSFLPMLLGNRKMGCGTILIIGVVGYFLVAGGGLNLGSMLGGGQPATQGQVQGQGGSNLEESCNIDASSREVCNTLSSLDKTWGQMIQGYTRPTLTFFSQNGQSGCGAAQSAMGPFYCPADNGVYLDNDFFSELDQKFGAAGDFARRYVIAHEVGHHIQTITGISAKVRQLQSRASEAEGNALQVRMELQADCLAGVWAAKNKDRLESGDIEEGMRAANAIGDDTLMRNAGRRPVPESFTHGTSEQRKQWLNRGLQSGNPNNCNTFEGIF
ncbi:zinc metalloprotease [Sphingorhabdus lutea]|uniref:Zinc metalloprotease n=1 Tax=Sphingorhabdus lutea TaxID=1913578 RepID=A0A1L3JBP1_9SPHN|nr:neutral zinc metallopeptidase [Sphingorhabdus lutea]APG62473.1 zinc metalloprotease [Sphingorhabdus lutea]